jgi:L-asparaginase II
MRAGRGDWVAKIGAEGVQGIGLRDAGIGIAIKVGDGNKRVLRPVIAAVLDHLQLFDARSRAELADWFQPILRNHRGLATGRIVSSVVLDKSATFGATRAAAAQ